MRWYETEAKEISPVLSTRARFARNLKDTPFPGQLDEAGKEKVFETVRAALADRDLTFVDFGKAGELEKNAYVQTHLASAALAKGGKGTGLALSRDGESALLINEEDHLRLRRPSDSQSMSRPEAKASKRTQKRFTRMGTQRIRTGRMLSIT